MSTPIDPDLRPDAQLQGEMADEERSWADDIRLVADRGDRAAFTRLFERFAPRIKGFLIRRGLPDGRAEDLAQETMLSVWRKAALFDPARAGAQTWIFAIARHQAVDAHRGARSCDLGVAYGMAALDDMPDDGPSQDHQLEGARRDRAVRAALANLPDEQKAIVELSFFSELAHPAIAERLGVPLGTVKSRMRLAMEKIRKSLEEYAP